MAKKSLNFKEMQKAMKRFEAKKKLNREKKTLDKKGISSINSSFL